MYDEIWAVSADRIKEYFLDTGQTLGKGVKVYELPEKQLGLLHMPQTRVIISGENADEVHRRFVMSFLSAGG